MACLGLRTRQQCPPDLARRLAPYRIATRLEISPRTVEVYKARMMEKLQCRTLADIVRVGMELKRPH